MHLTNYSINKMNENYVHPNADDIQVGNDGTKRTLHSLYQTLAERGIDVAALKYNIAQTCAKVM